MDNRICITNELRNNVAIGYFTLRWSFIKQAEKKYNLTMEYIRTKDKFLLDKINKLNKDLFINKYGYPEIVKEILLFNEYRGQKYKGYNYRDKQLNLFIYEKEANYEQKQS